MNRNNKFIFVIVTEPSSGDPYTDTGRVFCDITSKKYFDKHGCMNESFEDDQFDVPKKWAQEGRGIYSIKLSPEDAHKNLEDAGFVYYDKFADFLEKRVGDKVYRNK